MGVKSLKVMMSERVWTCFPHTVHTHWPRQKLLEMYERKTRRRGISLQSSLPLRLSVAVIDK